MPLSFKTALSVWVQPGDNQATGYNLKFGSEKIERERQLLAWNEFPRVECPQTSATFPQALCQVVFLRICQSSLILGTTHS